MSFFAKFSGGYQELWKAIIRPPRDDYKITDLGPKEFRLQGRVYKRTDLQIKNKRGLVLECSHFEPVKRVAKELPCVIYLHGNSSSRVEALPAVEVLLPGNITLFCLDFAGCGMSEGEYISLGWYERDDVDTIIEHLRKSGTVSTIGLWGRSMGAVTALMHADRDPSIAGMILDSPFADLRLLADELVKRHSKIPKWVANGALGMIRKTVQSKAKFDINTLVPIKHVEAGFVPAYFVAGKDDSFIDPHHTKDLHDKYSGEKKIVIVEGDHNSPRPQYLVDSIAIFFYNTLLVDTLPKDMDFLNHKESDSENSLKQSYLKHNFELTHKIGNEEDVFNILDDFNEDELQKAVEESLKLAKQSGLPVDDGCKIELPDDDKIKMKINDSGQMDKKEDFIEKIPFDFRDDE